MKRLQVTSLFLIIFAVFFSCKEKKEPQTEEAKTIKVKVQKVEEINFYKTIKCVGRISSEEELKLSFKTGGIIKEIYVKEGQNVKKGNVLAELNLSEIEASVKQTELGLEKAERDFQRIQNLYNDSVATLEQYQNIKTALDLAKSNVEIAEFNLKYSTIKAPYKGIILKKLAEKNEMIAPGYPVFLFGSGEQNWLVKTNLTDKQIINVSIGDRAKVYLDAYPDTFFNGILLEIGSFSDPYTGTFEVELQLEKINLKLVSGLIAKIEIFTKQKELLMKIPYSALTEANENSGYIYKLTGNQPVKQKVIIKKISDDYILVSKGLHKGDTIITEGVNYINKRQPIEIVN